MHDTGGAEMRPGQSGAALRALKLAGSDPGIFSRPLH